MEEWKEYKLNNVSSRVEKVWNTNLSRWHLYCLKKIFLIHTCLIYLTTDSTETTK